MGCHGSKDKEQRNGKWEDEASTLPPLHLYKTSPVKVACHHGMNDTGKYLYYFLFM